MSIRLEVDFYADGFRHCELELEDWVDTLPKCECRIIGRNTHQCRRGKIVEDVIHSALLLKGIIEYPELITSKRICKKEKIHSRVFSAKIRQCFRILRNCINI